MTTAIVIFGYCRFDKLRKVYEILVQQNELKNLPIRLFIDGLKEDDDGILSERYSFLKSLESLNIKNHSCVIRERNLGLKSNITEGVTQVLNEFDSAIILEDDVLPENGFLDWMLESLENYKEVQEIFTVCSYLPDGLVSSRDFLLPYFSCWGWATWKDRWDKVIWDTQIFFEKRSPYFYFKNTLGYSYLNLGKQLEDNAKGNRETWAIFVHSTAIYKGLVSLYPRISLTTNIGLDGTGTNSAKVSLPRQAYKSKANLKSISYKKSPTLINNKKMLVIFYLKLLFLQTVRFVKRLILSIYK